MFCWQCRVCPTYSENILRRPVRKGAKTHARMSGHTTYLYERGINSRGNRRFRILETFERKNEALP